MIKEISMRFFFALITAVLLTASYAVQAADAPDILKFESKQGTVTFDHKKHSELHAKKDCKVCHPTPWPQEKAPLNFKFPHKPHEAKKASCGGCHRPEGDSFSASVAANCAKCHVKGTKKG
jgi:c(7)-type cytochrome triheme protein